MTDAVAESSVYVSSELGRDAEPPSEAGARAPPRQGLSACLSKFGAPTVGLMDPPMTPRVNVEDFVRPCDMQGFENSQAASSQDFPWEDGVQDYVDPADWPEGVTTAMIRNIACRFNQEDVIRELEGVGLGGKFESVCVPRSRTGQSNLGYAFVNFWSDEYAKLCCSMCHGRVFGQSYTKKLCEVIPARIQGAAKKTWPARKHIRSPAMSNQKVQKAPAAAKYDNTPVCAPGLTQRAFQKAPAATKHGNLPVRAPGLAQRAFQKDVVASADWQELMTAAMVRGVAGQQAESCTQQATSRIRRSPEQASSPPAYMHSEPPGCFIDNLPHFQIREPRRIPQAAPRPPRSAWDPASYPARPEFSVLSF